MRQHSPYTFEAIGTHWWIEPLEAWPLSFETTQLLREYADTFNRQYSRFLNDSLIGRLNQTGELADPPKELISMLHFCREMFEVSEGAFNISVGGILHELGYGNRSRAGVIYEDPWAVLRCDKGSITMPRDMTIDTGGYGKGWLIDAFAHLLRDQGYQHFLINGGGDMYINAPEPIEIGLEHPYDSSRIVGTTRITQGALAVSGTTKRQWEHAGKPYHHLIDPLSKSSLENDVAGTYVRADTALIADTMATILMLRPDLKEKLSDRYGLHAIILTRPQVA